MSVSRLAIATLCLAAAGCSKSAPPDITPPVQTPARATKIPPPSAASPAGAQPPFAGGASAPPPGAAPTAPEGPSDAELAQLEAVHAKNPADAAAKSAYVAGLVAKANFFMFAKDLPPREKYPKALALYRKAVEVDPSNATAKAGVDQIEAIYTQMGREVPRA